MTNKPIARAERGYTLVELLVVLVLIGLIATAISAGFQFGTRVWERTQDGLADAETQETAQSVLRTLLASAIPRREDGIVRFQGEPDRLSFDAEPPAAFGVSDVVRVELSVTRGDSGLRVKMSSLVDPRRSREIALAGHPGKLRFAYLDASEKIPAWLDFWRDRPHLPDAVRLEAESGTAPASWPPFVVRLAIAQDARCEFDPVSTQCRTR